MNTSKKQNAKKERMTTIQEICTAKTFVHSYYPGDNTKTHKKYTILNLEINEKKSTIFLELRNSNEEKERYTLNHFEEFLNRKTGPFCTFEHGEISFFSYHSKAEYEAELAELEAKRKAAIAEREAAIAKSKKELDEREAPKREAAIAKCKAEMAKRKEELAKKALFPSEVLA